MTTKKKRIYRERLRDKPALVIAVSFCVLAVIFYGAKIALTYSGDVWVGKPVEQFVQEYGEPVRREPTADGQVWVYQRLWQTQTGSKFRERRVHVNGEGIITGIT